MELNELSAIVRTHWSAPGSHPTEIPSLFVHRFTDTGMEMPNTGDPYLYLVVDGMLRLHTPSGIMDYMPGQCSASAIDTPDFGYVLAPSANGDVIALSLSLALDNVISVMTGLDDATSEAILESTISQEDMDDADRQLVDVFCRLINASGSGARREFLAKLPLKKPSSMC
ncbi:MAG: AraC family transcriptional regulator N-terminal domain-containing protein [Coriobacteriales bacterium]